MCQRKEANPSLTIDELSEEYDYESKTMANRSVKFIQLEDALSIWTCQENLGAKYEANKKAWMTSEIFGHWIKSLNTINHLKCKKILVLVDNATSHIVNEELEHLYLQSVLEAMDIGEQIPHLNVKEAIGFTSEAWRNRKTKIVPLIELNWPSLDVQQHENTRIEIDIEQLISNISINSMQ
ncbi:8763_t:CDS:2, partial [Ambispora gerdemannii]